MNKIMSAAGCYQRLFGYWLGLTFMIVVASGHSVYAQVADDAVSTRTDTNKTSSEAEQTSNSKPTIKVDLVKSDGRWQLLRDNKPYYVLGGGGYGPLDDLADTGANSSRTWGIDDRAEVRARLDEAHRHGLTIAVGIWLEHERRGEDYRDYDFVVKQIDEAIGHVRALKNHPAILVWGIGNEMEGDGENAAVWMHVEHLARLVKQEDPNHPTMTVIAELGKRKVEQIHKLCPSIDIIGINSYGGSRSLPQRYQEQNGTKPYIVTEFGPVGTWEVPSNEFKAIAEPTSTAKAAMYRDAYLGFKNDPLCLGSYAFLWGNKQEGTATWFGMLLPDGKHTAAADAMSELWTGKPPANRCPVIDSLSITGSNQVKSGATVKVALKASDPDNDPFDVRWVLMAEADAYITGGDFQKTPQEIKDAITQSDAKGAVVKMPAKDGIYRLYAYAEDDAHNNAATANVPIRVIGQIEGQAPKATLPAIVFDEPKSELGADHAHYFPSGYMGSTESISLDENCTTDPKSGKTCLHATYSDAKQWGGVVWQHPANDWGAEPGGFDLTGAKKLTFWAKGKSGGEKIKFGFGLIKRDQKWFDTAGKEIEVELTNAWKQYEIECGQEDLRRIKSGFYWSLAGQGKPVEFYLDRIAFE